MITINENSQLGLLISAQLNMGLSLKTINEQLQALSKHPSLQKLKIQIEIDDKFVQSMNKFVSAAEKLKKVTDEQNKVIEETVQEFKKLDGSIEKVTQQVLKSGEVIKKTRTTHDENKKSVKEETQAIDEQRKSLEQLLAENDRYSKQVQTKTKYDSNGDVTGYTHTLQDQLSNDRLTVNTNKDGFITNYTEFEQQLKNQQAMLKEAEALDRAHYMALKTDQDRIEAQDKMHYLALQKNRDIDLKAQQAYQKQAELIDRAHYQALKTDQDRIEAQDKQHYIALQQNIKRDIDYQQSIADRQAKINDAMRRFGSDTNVKMQLNGLSSNLGGIQNIGDYKAQLRDVDIGLKNVTASANSARSNVMSFGESLQTAMQKFPIWMLASTAFFQTLHFFTQGIAFVNEFNAALTQIGTAVNYNVEKQQQLAQSFQHLGKEISASTKDVTAGALEFYRQGLGDDEVLKRLKTTTEYAKISGLDFKQSAELLTAATSSMNRDINSVSDVFTLLGDKTATSASEIGIAFQKVGGTANSLQVPFEKVASYIAAISAQTREAPEAIGSSLKSIMSRVESLKQKGFDETDGTKVNQVSAALAKAGIQLVDAQGQFRNFGTVLDELGAKWNSIDDRTKRYIATTVAGKHTCPIAS